MMSKKHNKTKTGLRECTYYIDGMHCASCEILIEKKFLKIDNVESVEASLGGARATVIYEGEKPTLDELNEMFKEQGYVFGNKKIKIQNAPPLISFSSGSLAVNSEKFKQLFIALALVLLFLIGFSYIEKSGLSSLVAVSPSSTMPTFFLFGLLAGTSSCAALVGGVLLSMSKQWNEVYIAEDSAIQRGKPFIMFNIGRLISFTILGGVLGAIGSIFGLSFESGASVFTAVLIIVVSLLMFFLAMQMLGVERFSRFQPRMPKFITRFVADEENFSGRYMPFLGGMATFFLPCGFTLVAQSLALTSGSFLLGMLIMLFFALGTLPMLALISFSSVKMNSRPHLTLHFNRIAGLLVLFFAIYNINAQLNVLGLPSLSDIQLGNGGDVAAEELVIQEGDTQKLALIAKGFEYIPTGGTVLKAGVPTVLEVDNQGISGCGAYMAARGLFDGYVKLESGINKIEFIPQAGQYKLTCTMGMVPPVTITVQ